MNESTLAPTLTDPVARVLLGGFVAVHLLLAIEGGGVRMWTNWVAFALTMTAGTIVVLVARLPALVLIAVCAALIVSVALTVLPLPMSGWPGYLVWPLGAATFVTLGLCLRQRTGAAWITMAGVVAVCVLWSMRQGVGPLPGLNLVIHQVGTLLIGTLFAVGLARAARTVAALQSIEQQRSLQRALAEAEGTELRRAAEHVLGIASTALERLARRGPVGDAERGEMLALEGRLRDEITGSALLSDRWNTAAAAARARGIDVVLLQDAALDHVGADPLHESAIWLADRLDAADPPRFTARILDRGGSLRVSAQWEGGSRITEIPYKTRHPSSSSELPGETSSRSCHPGR